MSTESVRFLLHRVLSNCLCQLSLKEYMETFFNKYFKNMSSMGWLQYEKNTSCYLAKTILLLISWFIMRIKELAWVRQKVNLWKIGLGGPKSLGLTDKFFHWRLVPPFESWFFWSTNSQSMAQRTVMGPNSSLYLPIVPRKVPDTGRYWGNVC